MLNEKLEKKIIKTNNLLNNTVLIDLDNLIEAPKEWNFYSELPADKFKELLESISNIGLQHNIVAWEQDNGKYMILSGHNRVRAYKLLREISDNSTYSKIPCVIKGRFEIAENEAKEIIIDSNWVQRELTPLQKAKSITTKYISLKEKALEEKVRLNINDIIAKEYNITDRQILSYKSLIKLNQEFKILVDEGKISIKAGYKISKLKPEVQAFLYDNYTVKAINKKYKNFKKDMHEKDIRELFSESKEKPMGTMKINYPDSNTGNIKEAMITYPKEDEKWFVSVIDTFCNSDMNLVIMEDDTYQSGDFIFSIIK